MYVWFWGLRLLNRNRYEGLFVVEACLVLRQRLTVEINLLRKMKLVTAMAMVITRKIAGMVRAAATPQDLAAARSRTATACVSGLPPAPAGGGPRSGY